MRSWLKTSTLVELRVGGGDCYVVTKKFEQKSSRTGSLQIL